jgi:nucleotide-binding universal stress UspA family protein
VVTTILVAVDGSPDSEVAVRWAGALAQRTGAAIVAVHAVGMLEHERGDPNGAHLRSRLDAWTEALGGLPADRVTRRLEPGDPAGVLRRIAAETDADMIVVGTRGAGARHGTHLGSTSLALAEDCPCPLVVVPQRVAT